MELIRVKSAADSDSLEDLLRWGWRSEKGLLYVINGAKGLCNAVQKMFGDYAQVQCCICAQVGECVEKARIGRRIGRR